MDGDHDEPGRLPAKAAVRRTDFQVDDRFGIPVQGNTIPSHQ
jgi:hypothetical protein